MSSPTITHADLSYEQTVPRRLAHRHALGEVFISDSAETGPNVFVVAAQIPRAHSLWSDHRLAYHDAFATAEAVRQGTFIVLHRHLQVPLGLPFSLRRFRFQVRELGAFQDDRRSPLQGRLTYRLAGGRTVGDELGDLTFEGELTVGGVEALEYGGDVVFMPRDDYEALRAYQRARLPLRPRGTELSPVPASAVGRMDGRNVVIGRHQDGPEGVRCELLPDLSHPAFFDHAYDHVPGPFIAEGFRQAAVVCAHQAGALESAEVAATGLDVTFRAFAEFDGDLECVAALAAPDGPDVVVNACLKQFGKVVAEGQIRLRAYPVGDPGAGPVRDPSGGSDVTGPAR
jgi:hypothetical protein